MSHGAFQQDQYEMQEGPLHHNMYYKWAMQLLPHSGSALELMLPLSKHSMGLSAVKRTCHVICKDLANLSSVLG